MLGEGALDKGGLDEEVLPDLRTTGRRSDELCGSSKAIALFVIEVSSSNACCNSVNLATFPLFDH